MADRLEALYRLGDLRRATEPPVGCFRIGDFHNGAYETEFVSPYSKTAGNISARVFLVLQDWAGEEFLKKDPVNEEVIQTGRKKSLATNKNLDKLICQAFGLSIVDTFGTNAFPFVKPGGMSAKVKCLPQYAELFVLPQVEIIAPEIVVCVGLDTFNCVIQGLGEAARKNMIEAMGRPVQKAGITYWCQAHTGNQGARNRLRSTGSELTVLKDWKMMRELDNPHSCPGTTHLSTAN